MDIKGVIQSQYLAALEMLAGVVNQCPESLWEDQNYKNQFWQVAYHALFYTHLYLQPSEGTFVPWAKHRAGNNRMEEAGEPYTKAEILEYFDVCRKQVSEQVPILEFDGPSGFYWLPFNKLELQFYNIRHIQQHCGELCERLGVMENIEVDWVGMVPAGGKE
jgi:DinB superfamily